MRTTVLVKTMNDCGSSRLVDDTEDLRTGHHSDFLHGLLLSIVEVWDGDNRKRNLWTEVHSVVKVLTLGLIL